MYASDGNWHLTQVLTDESQFTLDQTAFPSLSVPRRAPRWVLIVQKFLGNKNRQHAEQVAEVLTRALASFSSRQQTRMRLRSRSFPHKKGQLLRIIVPGGKKSEFGGETLAESC